VKPSSNRGCTGYEKTEFAAFLLWGSHIMQTRHVFSPVVVRLTGLGALCLFLAVSSTTAQEVSPTKLVEGPMAKLKPLIGTWEIDTEWRNGSALWARNEYLVGVGGRFIEARTFAKNQSGHVYQRYMTVFGYDQDKNQYHTWGFTYDGTEKTVPFTVTDEDGKTVISSEWEQEAGTSIRQTVTFVAGTDAYDWKVWQKSDGGDWEEVMDGTWQRVTEP
jgi:hypothetical protein